MKKILILCTLSALAIIMLLTACAPGATSGSGARGTPTAAVVPTKSGRGAGDTLRILYWQAPTVLNPHLAQAAKDRSACRLTYEPLASYDKDGNLIPFLAAEIPTLANGGIAADGKSVRWKLKQDVKWSDGQPFTAKDVLFTYQFAVNPDIRAATAGTYSAISSVEVLDDYRVQLNFKNVNPEWALPFVGVMGMILPAHAFTEYPGVKALQAPVNNLPIGTGPFRVMSPGVKPEEVLLLGSDLVPTNKITLEPNPYFREPDKPYFSRVIIKGGGTADEAARSVLQVGDVDWTHNLQSLSTQQLSDFQAASTKGQMLPIFGLYVERILLNETDPNKATDDGERSNIKYPHPFLTDLKVRQAFSLAIDREAVAKLYGPTGRLTTNMLVSPANFNSSNTKYEFSPQKAAALLDEAGWKDSDGDGIRDRNGVKMSVMFQTSVDTVRQQVQELVKQNLSKIGVEVRLEIIDSSVFLANNPSNPKTRYHFYADLEMFSTGNLNPDPGSYMKWWTCDEITQKANNWAGRNIERWCNKDYDALYNQVSTQMDPAKRQQLFIQMNDMIINSMVLIPLANRAEVYGASNTLAGIDLTPWDADTWNIKDWRRIAR